jgi:hypothetical protein
LEFWFLLHQDEMVESSEDEPCSGDTDATTDPGQEHSSRLADRELKEMLLKKYSGCLSRLRSEFLKKRKKGKLPKDARSALMDWWNTHYRWPYPTVTCSQHTPSFLALNEQSNL